MRIELRVATNIRKYRTLKKWSQEQLALAADLHRAYIGQIERGEKSIGVKNLEIIAKALGVNTTALIK